ncbi:MAG: hypothetical protein ACYCZJ_15585 [Sulfuriferula sp.]
MVNAKQTSVALKKVKIMMTDEEFFRLLKALFKLSMEDGDIGYMYWTKVIEDLKEMRAVYLAQIASGNPEHDK